MLRANDNDAVSTKEGFSCPAKYDSCPVGQHVRQLEAMCEKLVSEVAELKARIAKNSSNSSKPPSSDGLSKPSPKSLRKKGKRKPGGQFGHRGKTLEMVECPSEIIVHSLSRCPCGCKASLEDEPLLSYEKRQVFELPEPKLTVIEHRAEVKLCPNSGAKVTAVFAPDVKAPVQYGPGFTAFLVYLRNQQLLPLERIGQLCADLFGYTVSEATIVSATNQAADSLGGFVEAVEEMLTNTATLHADETGLRANGKLSWLHVLSTENLTWYGVHAKRGGEALRHFGILPHFSGRLIHDCWNPYFGLDCSHGLCNAHILRELRFCHEELGQVWADKMAHHLLATHRLVEHEKQAGATGLHEHRQDRVRRDYDIIVSRGIIDQPPACPALPRRGRTKKSKAENLLGRLDKYRDLILAFSADFRTPFTNNLAEQDVRMMKVQQKISGGFRTFEGAQKFALVRSYLSTVRKHGLDVLPAIQNALCGQPFIPGRT